MHLFLWLLNWLFLPSRRHGDRKTGVAASTLTTWRQVVRERQARVRLNRGRTLLAKGLWDEAEAQFGMALELAPHLGLCLPKRQKQKLLNEFALAKSDQRHKNIRLLADQLDR